MAMAELLAAERLLAELRARPGTRAQLAKRTGINPGYAGEVLLGLQAAGRARRWKRPGTRGYLWEAASG